MKTAIYIEDGLIQFVLTPETDIDKQVLKEMESTNLRTYRGNFYACLGGWTRQDPNHWQQNLFLSSEGHPDESLIFVIDKKATQVVSPKNTIAQPDAKVPTVNGHTYHHTPETFSFSVKPGSTISDIKLTAEPHYGCVHDPFDECGACRTRRTFGS